jgi:hypothetical protein
LNPFGPWKEGWLEFNVHFPPEARARQPGSTGQPANLDKEPTNKNSKLNVDKNHPWPPAFKN